MDSSIIQNAFEQRSTLSASDLAELRPVIDQALSLMDKGVLRSADIKDGTWVVNALVKQVILLNFLATPSKVMEGAFCISRAFDKFSLKFDSWTAEDFLKFQIRVVPGAVVRYGAYIASGVVLMPCFVNVGASIGEKTMIDTWATVGSCAQVGSGCHISGGAGIGGVLEPLNASPVIIEDNVFVGARSEVAEGVIVRRGAVIGMGVFLSASTPIIDRASGRVFYGEVPEDAVVISGSRVDPANPAISIYAAVIVKYADQKTRGKTALNNLVRGILN
ncbi:2,3,4,5-tetrahydropyridine-2,6-dicarboxylate N-succinyltransferase [Pseudomonas sp. S2_H01]